MDKCIEVKQSREMDDLLEEEGPLDGETDWDLELLQNQYERLHSSSSDRAVCFSDGVDSPMEMNSPWVMRPPSMDAP